MKPAVNARRVQINGSSTVENAWARNVLAGFAAVVALSGCAGNAERAGGSGYGAELTRAAQSIDEAERAATKPQGSGDLNRARQKLAAARKASDEGDKGLARRLAVEASLDAQVAAAAARNQVLQNAVAEVHESIRVLQDDLRRDEQRSLGRL
jgi:hypothetical protein